MRLFLYICLCIILTSPALAQTLGRVGTARVIRGESEIETRFAYLLDDKNARQDNRLQARVHYDYGFTDWYALRLITTADNRQNDNWETNEILNIENRFQFLDRQTDAFDFGIRAGFLLRDGDKTPHSVVLGFLEQLPLDNGDEIRFSQIFSREIGQDATSGISLDLRGHYMHTFSDKGKLGFEVFSDLQKLNEQSGYSNHEHAIGPVYIRKLPHGLKLETGYRVGISQAAPDHAFKLFLGAKF